MILLFAIPHFIIKGAKIGKIRKTLPRQDKESAFLQRKNVERFETSEKMAVNSENAMIYEQKLVPLVEANESKRKTNPKGNEPNKFNHKS